MKDLRRIEIEQVTGLKPVQTVMGTPRLRRAAVKSGIGTPQFPGAQSGMTIDQIRDVMVNAKRLKGFNLTIDAGTTITDIKLSGNARLLLGLAILLVPAMVTADTIPDTINLTVNNDIVIDTTNPKFLSPEFCDEEYYYIPRPLSGTDQITLTTVSAAVSQKMRVVFYYL